MKLVPVYTNTLKAIARRHPFVRVNSRSPQPQHIAQVAIISGSMVGDDNHHCRERKIQSPPNKARPRLRTPNWARSQAGASTTEKILSIQQKENPRSKSKIKKPQSWGRNHVV